MTHQKHLLEQVFEGDCIGHSILTQVIQHGLTDTSVAPDCRHLL